MTSTAPATCVGETTVSDEPEPTANAVPATPSNVTLVAPVNAEPVNVTVVPPDVGPDEGDTFDTTGAATYVNVAALDEP